MRGLFWILALFATAVGLSLVARYNDGYVLLFVAPKRIELSLTLFAILQISAFVLMYFFVRAAAYTLRLPDMVREFRATRLRQKARHALFDALVSTHEGRYARAERAARLAHDTGEEPALAALVAARAAHQLGRSELREEWLERASLAARRDGGKSLSHAVLMTRAELLSEQRRDGEALEVLAELNRGGARHIATQRLALASMVRVGAWDEALRTARQLEEHKAIHPALMHKTREEAYGGLFASSDAQLLCDRLRRVPREERLMVPVARTIARGLIAAGVFTEARELIETALDCAWDDELGALYADCNDAGGGGRLEHCEAWRARYPGEAGLLLTLGRICAAMALWGKAQEYLEMSLALRPGARVHLELARVFDAAGRIEEANRQFRMAVQT